MMKTLIITLLFSLMSLSLSQPQMPTTNAKYQKWQNPAYFRGYNLMNEGVKLLQDFVDFKNYGGNMFMIGTRGFVSEDAPYAPIQSNIDGVDKYVSYCRQTGIHYVIAVRSGPGAYDTYMESSNQSGESRIWNTNDTMEQRLYANMLKSIVQRYKGDTLFVGLNILVEPRPKVREVPANTSALYKSVLEGYFNIHMDRVYNYFVSQIRTVDNQLPLLIENFAYSTPELFPPYTISGSYLVYTTHNYQPVEFSKAPVDFTVTYPGVYWNITFLQQRLFDSTFIRQTLFSRVRAFQLSANVPVFLGEFGMFHPQTGGDKYINDVLSACKDYGWHFALWDWRRRSGENWNIEGFEETEHAHWRAVLKYFKAPPVPKLRSPIGGINLTSQQNLVFKWDSLTSYTKYDLTISDASHNIVLNVTDLISSTWQYSGSPLQNNMKYYWRVRSKNPGGLNENNSAWSATDSFTIGTFTSTGNGNSGIPKVYKLNQNFPNPFNPSTHISFELPQSSNVSIVLFDVIGREVETIYSGYTQAGYYNLAFDGFKLSSGIYYYKITTDNFTDTKKMILLK